MMNVEKYQKLKKRVESLKAEADRAEGAKEQLMQKLQDEFDCSTVKEADELLSSLEVKKKKVESKYVKALTAFEDKWGEKLT